MVVLLGGGGYFSYYVLIQAPQPQLDGDLHLTGLNDKVEVVRDSYGIPSIYAQNMHDLLFAQGYVQAQDRWWQMEFLRHVCGGRIEELTGKKDYIVPLDIYMRTLGLYTVAQKEYDMYTPEQRLPLDAFAQGVNACIAGRSPQQLSLNYTILGLTGVKFKIEPWSPLDTLVFAKLMAFDLSLSEDTEQARSRLDIILGENMTDLFLLPPWPNGQKPTIMQPEDVRALVQSFPPTPPQNVSGNMTAAPAASAGAVYEDPSPDLSAVTGMQDGVGSNSWVATGGMTQSGKALLANDPHLGIQMPSIWYEVALHCPDDGSGLAFDVAGFTFAACPGVVIGHNNYIAWGCTNVYPDVNDQYMLKISSASPLQYQWNNTWRDITLRREEIDFGDGKPPITIEVRETHIGPIINDNQYDEKSGTVQGYNNRDPLALRWTALEPSTLILAISALDRATSWDDFRNALKLWDVPSQSIIFADTLGNIGYQMPGKIPIRPQGYNGQVPTPGWGDAYMWKGYIPYELLPTMFDPSRGYIVAANNEVAPPAYYDFLNQKLGPGANADFGSLYNKWNYGYRAQRINQMLPELAPNTVISFESIQGDNKYLPAAEVMPYLASLKFTDPDVSAARDWLLQWDGRCSQDSPQAALYMEFWLRLIKNTFQNKLGDVIHADGSSKDAWAINLLLQKPDDKWWDDPATPSVETRDDILALSFSKGYAATVAALGGDRDAWTWGSLHVADFISNPLGASGMGLLKALVNRTIPVSGNGDCVNATMWFAGTGPFLAAPANPFAPLYVPSMRMIVDMSDLSKCVAVNSTGQSGNPGSPWYGDMIDDWANINYHPMLWTRQQVDAAAAHKLNLGP